MTGAMAVSASAEPHPGARLDFELPAELLVFAFEEFFSAEVIDGTIFGRSHEPGARIVRNARLGPSLERDHERVLG